MNRRIKKYLNLAGLIVLLCVLTISNAYSQFVYNGGGSSDSLGIDTNGDGVVDNYIYPSFLKKGTNITFTVTGDTLEIAGPVSSGTADSLGIDVNGDGVVDNYLYSIVGGAFHLKKGTNITFTVTGDTLEIAGPVSSGTADSIAVDTSGSGDYATIYSIVGEMATIREGSGIDLTVNTDTFYIAATLGTFIEDDEVNNTITVTGLGDSTEWNATKDAVSSDSSSWSTHTVSDITDISNYIDTVTTDSIPFADSAVNAVLADSALTIDTTNTGFTTYIANNSRDSIGVDTDGNGTIDNYIYPSTIKKGANITLTVNSDTLTIAGPTSSGTADSMGVDTDGDGVIDNYLYSTIGGAFHLKEGANITFTVTADTLEISGPAAAGTADSLAVDTSGSGDYAYVYSTVSGGAFTLRKGTGIDFTVSEDTFYISSTLDTASYALTITDTLISYLNLADTNTYTLNILLSVDTTIGDSLVTYFDTAQVVDTIQALNSIQDGTILSTYETIANVGLIGDDTVNYQTAYGWGDWSGVVLLLSDTSAFHTDIDNGTKAIVSDSLSWVKIDSNTVGLIDSSGTDTLLIFYDGTNWNIGDTGLSIMDSVEINSFIRFVDGTDTLEFIPELVDSMINQKGVYASGSGSTDSIRLGNGINNLTDATQDTLSAPTDTIEVDTTVLATLNALNDSSATSLKLDDTNTYTLTTLLSVDTTIGDTTTLIRTLIGKITDDTTNYQTAYNIANVLDTFSRLPMSRVYFDTLTGATPDTLKVIYSDSSNIALFDTDDLTEGATNLYDQPIPDSSLWQSAAEVNILIEDSLNEYSLTTAISSTYETIVNVALIGDDTTKWNSADSVINADSAGWNAGVTDHGLLTGLLDDDHPQYLKESDTNAFALTILLSADTTIGDSLTNYTPTSGLSISNWNTAYSWGDWSAVVLLLSDTNAFAITITDTLSSYSLTSHVHGQYMDSAIVIDSIQANDNIVRSEIRDTVIAMDVGGLTYWEDSVDTDTSIFVPITSTSGRITADSSLEISTRGAGTPTIDFGKYSLDSIRFDSMVEKTGRYDSTGKMDTTYTPFQTYVSGQFSSQLTNATVYGDLSVSGYLNHWNHEFDPDVAKGHANNANNEDTLQLHLFSRDGTDSTYQNVHPSITYIPQGFMGYKVWAVISGFPASMEDAYVLCTNTFDSLNNPTDFHVYIDSFSTTPTYDTANNPILNAADVGASYCSDGHLFFGANSKLWAVTRAIYGYPVVDSSKLYVQSTSDGLTWSDTTSILTVMGEGIVSPTIFLDTNSTYKMFVTTDSSYTSYTNMYSAPKPDTEFTFISRTNLHSSNDNIYKVWHSSILPYSPDMYLAIIKEADSASSGAGGQLSIAKSRDGGLTWSDAYVVMQETGDTNDWDGNFLYRADGYWSNDGEHNFVKLMYSASGYRGTGSSLFNTAFTNLTFDNGGSKFTIIPDLLPGLTAIDSVTLTFGEVVNGVPIITRDSAISATGYVANDTLYWTCSALPKGITSIDTVIFTYMVGDDTTSTNIKNIEMYGHKTNSIMADSVYADILAGTLTSLSWVTDTIAVNSIYNYSEGDQMTIKMTTEIDGGNNIYIGRMYIICTVKN